VNDENPTMTTQSSTPRPGDAWREALRLSAVPQSILDSAPDPEPTLEPERFRWKPEEDATQPVRPSRRRALEALPEGGSVLDVGVGGGASSLGLVPKAGLIVGVDPLEGMLESFQASALEAGVATKTVHASWPEAADEVGTVDVAVCHHAMYRVAEIEDFVLAMTAHAKRRVVVELSALSPLAALNPLWKIIHGIDRPDFPVADQVQEVLVALGLAVEREDMVLPPRAQEVTPQLVAFSRRRLYVGPERDAEIEEFLRSRVPQEHRVVALWWSGAA
jgi:SAM-dependent methyltransferase